jgi:CO/xanthine dehydrogenase Mo-binding subunit
VRQGSERDPRTSEDPPPRRPDRIYAPHRLDEEDERLDPIGGKGTGEIGTVGTAAAIANAVYHATGTRIRDLPLRFERIL